MKTQTPNQAKKGKMKKREWKKELDILFGLIGDDREHWKKGDWHWTKSGNESIAYKEMRARWFSCADRIIAKAIAQEREQVLGKVEKYFRENYIAGHIEDDEELIILKGWSDKWFKFLNSLRTQEKGEK